MSKFQRNSLLCWILSFSLWFVLVNVSTAAPDSKAGSELARRFLSTSDAIERGKLAGQLVEYDGVIDAVLQGLRQQSFPKTKSGFRPREKFTVQALRKRHPDDLLYFTVPESYRRDKPTGLIVFMHGGGRTTSRRAPGVFLDFPEEDGPEIDMAFGDVFADSGMIAVGPSAPWDEDTAYRWCVDEAEAYLADVILECKSRFNIDPDRVVLMGHSMGGFGAFHHIQRSPDRFAAVISSSGSWMRGYWPAIRGTKLYFINGVHDARAGVRWHYTDVEYGRQTDKLLTAAGINHQYVEHNGKHSIGYNRKQIAAMLKEIARTPRDPYYPHIALATPMGYSSNYCSTVTDNRWLSLNETTRGEIEFDELRSNGSEDFDEWRLRHRTREHRGASIEAVNEGNNRIKLTTQNVRRLTVWLHPKMVDVGKPVRIVVDGKTRFEGRVRPSLETALESYERRQDWGLVYPMKIEIGL